MVATFSSCRKGSVPKPYGYFRIAIPDTAYEYADLQGYPYTFQLSKNAYIEEYHYDGEQYWIGDTRNEGGKDVKRIIELGVSDFNTVLVSNDSNWYDSNISYSYEIKNPKDQKTPLDHSYAMDKSTHFTGYFFSNFYGKAIENGCLIGQTYIVVNISKSLGICTTAAEFKQYCIDNNVKFYKVLQNPIITDISPEEIEQYNAIKMNSPHTTILNDAGAHTEVEYVVEPEIL